MFSLIIPFTELICKYGVKVGKFIVVLTCRSVPLTFSGID